MRVTKISCVLPVGVKLGGLLPGALGLIEHFWPTLNENAAVKETRSSNKPLTLELEVPEGQETATIAALGELIKDLQR